MSRCEADVLHHTKKHRTSKFRLSGLRKGGLPKGKRITFKPSIGPASSGHVSPEWVTFKAFQTLCHRTGTRALLSE
jgi:hypothetical protein